MALSDVKRLIVTTALATPLAAKVDRTELAQVATSGLYTDLINKPDFGSAAFEQKENFATSAEGDLATSAVQPNDPISDLSETSGAKIMTAAERTKLAGVAPGATANDTDANLKNRANHTGTQPIATVEGLPAALDGLSTSRIAGDAALGVRIDGEEAARTSGDAEANAARESGDNALNGRVDRVPMDRGPSIGFIPGQNTRAATYSVDATGAIRSAVDQNGEQLTTSESGLLMGDVSFVRGPSHGFLPGEASPSVSVTTDAAGALLDAEDESGHVFQATRSGSLSAQVATMRGPSLGLSPASGQPITEGRFRSDTLDEVVDVRGGEVSYRGSIPRAANDLPAADPRSFDAGSSTVPVEAGEILLPSRRIAWAAGAVTSPAPANVAVTDEAIAAGNGIVTHLTYELIASVAAVRRASDDAPRVEGTHYRIDRSRGFVANLTADALEIDYIGSPGRKDIVSIDPREANPALTITQGAAKPRNAHLYAQAPPASHMEIARVTRKGPHAFYIPRWKWRNGVHVDRQAEYAAALDHNRRITAPMRQRLITGQRVRIIAHGNSRVSIGTGGNLSLLNTNPNSKSVAGDPAQSWIRDVPGYYELYSQADRALFGFDTPSLETFNNDVGYNLPGGTHDGFGAVHVRAGYVWEMLKALHAAYPNAIIDYRNWGIGGTNSSDTIQSNGAGNALYPARWNAVKADIIAGETIFIPIDNMNEGPAIDSYANWTRMAREAQALGAVIHFMGGGRTDPRFSSPDVNLAAFQMGEMARAASDTGSAFSDSWRFLAPENLCGLGLCEDELMDAGLENHEGVPLQRPTGRDAAQAYL